MPAERLAGLLLDAREVDAAVFEQLAVLGGKSSPTTLTRCTWVNRRAARLK